MINSNNQQKLGNSLDLERYIFWLDKSIENNENKNYIKRLEKEFPKYKIKAF